MKLTGMSCFVLITILTTGSYCQMVYIGKIGKAAVELVLVEPYYSNDTTVSGVYLYKKYNQPIALTGTLKGKKISLFEIDQKQRKTGQFIFDMYDKSKHHISGTWKNLETNASFPFELTLKEDVEIDAADSAVEVLQYESIANYFFKLLVSIGTENSIINGDLIVSGIKVIDKKNGKVKQVIRTDCRYFKHLALNNLEVDDYNFDEKPDISIQMDVGANANGLRLYIIWDFQRNCFYDTGFKGTNLIFDYSTKTVREPVSDPGEDLYQITNYSVVKNKLILRNKHCLKYNLKTNDYDSVKCE